MQKIIKKLGLLILVCASLVLTQPVQSKILDLILPFLGNTQIDVLSYHFDIAVPSVEANDYQIDMKIVVVPGVDSTELELHTNLKLITVSQIFVDGKQARFSYLKGIANKSDYGLAGDVLLIEGIQLSAGEAKEVQISYRVALSNDIEQSGLFSEGQLESKILLTRNWPYYGRFWFPSNDTPLDPAKVSYKISTPPGYVAIANGKLTRQDNQDFYWEQEKATSTYNFIFSVGKFSVYKEEICFDRGGADNHRADCATAQVKIPLEIYYDPAVPWQLNALKTVKKDVSALIYFSKLFGNYEFEKVGFLLSSYPFNMESTSLIVLNNPHATVHEIAHHWFGNNVVIPHWGDFWISEGFTTYVTGLYDEYLTGKNTSCFDDSANDVLNNPDSTDPNEIFNSIPYCKGASAIHNLRLELAVLSKSDPKSTEAFLKLLSQLYLNHRGKALSTEQFIQFVSQNSQPVYQSLGLALDSADLKQSLDRWSHRWFVLP